MIAPEAVRTARQKTASATDLPSRSRPRGDIALQSLFDTAAFEHPSGAAVRGGLGRALSTAYDGDLSIRLRADRPIVIANFVETVDGVVALDAGGRTGGGEVSGFNPADRLVMTLLRSLADVVLVGGGTLRASDGGTWTGRRLRPDLADDIAELRRRLGLRPQPTTVVVTRMGDVPLDHPGLADPEVPVVIAAAEPAVDRLRRVAWPDHVRVQPLPSDRTLGAAVLLVAKSLGARLVLSEAGPHVTAALAEDGLLDELFLTVSPQLAGRASGADRLSLIEGIALWPNDPRWLRLVSVRRAVDHLFLRYRFEEVQS